MGSRVFMFVIALVALLGLIAVLAIMVGHVGCSPGPRPSGYSPAQWVKIAQSMCN